MIIGPTTTLTSVWISWFALSPSTANFASYGGEISRNQFSGSWSSDISNTLYQTPYNFYGITLLSLLNSSPVSFTATLDPNFILTLNSNSSLDRFSIFYFIIGNLPSKLCSSCGNGLYVYNSHCIRACPPALSYAFTYKDGGLTCKFCSATMGLTLSNGSCVARNATPTNPQPSQGGSSGIPPVNQIVNPGTGSGQTNTPVNNPTVYVPTINVPQNGQNTNTNTQTGTQTGRQSGPCRQNSYFNGF